MSKAETETEAAGAIKNFFEAFNAHDNEAYMKTLHFPHIRISGNGDVLIARSAVDFRPLDRTLAFLAKKEGWDHSGLDSMEVIHVSDVKVHFNIEFSRYKKDGTRYAVHNSLWVITKKDGQWGVQARSSYAP